MVDWDKQTNHQPYPWTHRTKCLGTQIIHTQGLLENSLSYIHTWTICRFSTKINTNLNFEYPELLAIFKGRTLQPLTKLQKVTNTNTNQSHFHWNLTSCMWTGNYLEWRLCAPVTLLCISHFFVFAAQAYVYTVLHLENDRMGCSHSWKSG